MVSTFSSNIQLEEPAFGDQAGTWDTPVNSNWTILDLILGGVTTVAASTAANITLTSSQYQCKTIILNSTLTNAITVTFPTSFVKSYEIMNQCTGSSAFVVTLKTTAAGAKVICPPPGVIQDVYNGGADFSFKSLHRVGKYMDYAGSSVPAWISGCTVPPYLNCDGTTFSSATYPQLATILGSTTLPDSRGRLRFALNQTTARVTSAISGIDGNTRFTAGGSELLQLHNHGVTDPGHTHTHDAVANVALGNIIVNVRATAIPGAGTISAAGTGITLQSTAAGTGQNVPPAYIGGLTLIRAA